MTLRIALRTLGRHRGFALVAILSLAIAIALNTTMYSVLDAMLRPRISARKPENLYFIRYFSNDNVRTDYGAIERALTAKAHGFDGITGAGGMVAASKSLIENGSRYFRAYPLIVRPNYFQVLGTDAVEGRVFAPKDSLAGTPTVISDQLAAKLFPDESPVGKTLTIDGVGYTVIGVVPRSDVFGPLYGTLWILRPASARPTPLSIIRLKDGVDLPALEGELKQIAAQLALDVGLAPGKTGFLLRKFERYQFRIGSFHWALIGAVMAVLLVACANLGNLQLARGLARTRELALRSAVGASRARLVRHLLLETSLLAVAGLVLGTLLTLWGIHIVKASVPPVMNEYMIQPQTSWRMFAFAAVAALVCLFLVGLLPSLHVSRVDPNELLKSGAGTGSNRTHRRRYGLMVIAQIALALPVLAGAAAVIKSGWAMHRRDYALQWYGYDPTQLVSATVTYLSDSANASVPAAQILADVVSRATLSPGIVDAGGMYQRAPVKHVVSVDDENGVVREEPAPLWSYSIVSPTYFRTFGRTMERGRDFVDGESSRSVIVDAGSAKYLWGSHNPVGRSIKFGDARSDEPWYRVVGVVHDSRDTTVIRRMDYTWGFRLSNVYRLVQPNDVMALRYRSFSFINIYARAQGNTELAAVRLQRQLRASPVNQHLNVVPLADEQFITYTRTRQDFVSSLFSTFAFLGLCLVAIGVYGIVAHTVAERKRELAVRISLGATARDVLRSVLREGNVLLLAGVAFGLLFTKYTVWWLGAFLDDDVGYNAFLFGALAVFLFLLAIGSAFVPAWRATRIDPVDALRHE